MERRRGEQTLPTYFFVLSLGVFFFSKPDVFLLQVFRFVQNLIGCEEQARLFKEEVRTSVCEYNFSFMYLNVGSYLHSLLSCHTVDVRTAKTTVCYVSVYLSLFVPKYLFEYFQFELLYTCTPLRILD